MLNLLEELQEIPCVPFITQPMRSFITSKLRSLNLEYEDCRYSIIVKPKIIKANQPKIVLMAHTDHPGIALKNDHEGILFGSVGKNRLNDQLAKSALVPIRIYDPSGQFIGTGRITSLYGKNNNRVGIQTEETVSSNSSGQFDIPYYAEDERQVRVYNADNGASVAVMLYLLSQKIGTTLNLYYVFNLYEETHQISSWYLAKHNILALTKNDYVFNLECLRVENTNHNQYSSANYEDGLVLQLSNTGCLFGYKSSLANQAELVAKNIAARENIPLQIGLIKDSCDCRPFTQFNITPNLCTITIPNQYKHNQDYETGNIVPEKIYKNDIRDLAKLAQSIVELDPGELNKASQNHKGGVAREIKKNDDVTDPALMRHKAVLNQRLEIVYRDVVKRSYYYPTNLKENWHDAFLGFYSYLKYFYLKLFSTH